MTRKDFPLFSSVEGGQQLVYLDHAATSQKPRQVLETLRNYYSHENANVHRGAHQLSAKATEAFEAAREKTARFINVDSSNEILFTRNATEGINLVARSWGDSCIREGDEIILTLMEHHSNIVPWQMLAKRSGCVLKYVDIDEKGQFNFEDFRSKISSRTKLVTVVHISNALGCCNPIAAVTELAHKYGALVMVDGCQSLAHHTIDIPLLDIDFLVGSSHKLCGPTGVGFLWAREEILELMPPMLGGGEMIQDVFLDHSTWAELPHKFEAGTPAIGEAIAMGTALDYLTSLGMENIQAWEQKLMQHLFAGLTKINGLQILGPTLDEQPNRGVLATFIVDGIHANDISALLDARGICIRSGHHCCQPLHRHFGITASARASLSFTSTMSEIDFFLDELNSAIQFLKLNS